MRQLSFATNRGCCTSISTWHCCPSAVTQSTVSPLKLRKLCQCVRVLFSNLFWSSHFIFLALSFLGSLLSFWQTLTETFSLSSVVHLHFRHFQSRLYVSMPVWLGITRAKWKQGNGFSFLLFYPILKLFMMKVLVRSLSALAWTDYIME